MNNSESITDFYKRISLKNPTTASQNKHVDELGHFNVFRRSDIDVLTKNYKPYNRRDFYKISLIIGTGRVFYADKGIDIDKNALLFSNPNIPYAWEPISEEQSGYFCLFTESFIKTSLQNESLRNSPLLKIDADRVFFVDKRKTEQISEIFEKMLLEIDTDYLYKLDLIKNYINLIVHEALKMQPADSYFRHTDAASRITSMFIELLERQFPVSDEQILQLKSATDFAYRLSVHTNHLNRAVKKITGKTTTDHISARIYQEAKALLLHTDWNISDVAYCLGFENPSYFNNFFRKHENISPRKFRA